MLKDMVGKADNMREKMKSFSWEMESIFKKWNGNMKNTNLDINNEEFFDVLISKLDII